GSFYSRFNRLSVFVLSFFFSSRRRHTRFSRDWSSDVCSSDLSHEGQFIGRRQTRVGLIYVDRRRQNESAKIHLISNLPRPILTRSEERRVGKECRYLCTANSK